MESISLYSRGFSDRVPGVSLSGREPGVESEPPRLGTRWSGQGPSPLRSLVCDGRSQSELGRWCLRNLEFYAKFRVHSCLSGCL